MVKIGIVTDSTADLPLSYYKKNDVIMVPLVVRFGDEVHKDWIEMTPDKFYQRLRGATVLPKTSQPPVKDFVDTYKNLAKSCEKIISVHLSSKLSGTVESAEVAKGMVDIPVTIIDTGLASLGTGMVVDALVEAREQGKPYQELLNLGQDIASCVRVLFTVDTLKYLEMGGRIGKAQALAGSLLNIKPILTLDGGEVVPYKKVKGKKRVFQEMITRVLEEASEEAPLKFGFAHADSLQAIEHLKSMLKDARVSFSGSLESEVGTVIGTYTGPGAFAVMFYPSLQEATRMGG